MNKQLSKKITVYNFIFTICIVVYHWKSFNLLFASQQTFITDTLYVLYDAIGYIALGTFFMISGYLFYCGIDNKQNLIEKIRRRISTLVVPFFVWNMLMLVYNIVFRRVFDISFKYFLLGFSFTPFDGPLWYMFALILLMMASPFIIKLKKYPKLFAGILLLVFVSSYFCGTFPTPHSEALIWIFRLVYYLPLYLLGAYFGLCKSNFIADEKYNSKTVSTISILFSLAALIYILFFDLEITSITWIILHILPITIWLSFCNAKFDKAPITYPMQTTFFVYAMHSIIIGFINTFVTKISNHNSLHYAVSIIIHLLLVVILYLICMASAFIAKKVLPSKLFDMLSGGRTK